MQSFKDVKQPGSDRNGILTHVSESIAQVLGIEYGLLGKLLLSIFIQHPVDGTSAACLLGL